MLTVMQVDRNSFKHMTIQRLDSAQLIVVWCIYFKKYFLLEEDFFFSNTQESWKRCHIHHFVPDLSYYIHTFYI
jgi:hypothetical protein